MHGPHVLCNTVFAAAKKDVNELGKYTVNEGFLIENKILDVFIEL